MASLRQAFGMLKKPMMTHRMPAMYQLLARNASHGDGPPPPPIKPPGPEWVPGKWKNDGTGYGDYPNYTEWSYQDREPRPADPYWDDQDRRYFGEPVHVNDDILNMWMPDEHSDMQYSPREQLLHVAVAFGVLGGIYWFSENVYDAKSHDPVVAKPYPYNNLYLERGGDPNKEPTEKDLTARIKKPYYGF